MGMGQDVGKGAAQTLGGCLALVALAALAILALVVIAATGDVAPDRRPSRELSGTEIRHRETELAILCPALKALPVADYGVGRMQCALSLLGYGPGPIDGRMGRKTQDALAAYRETIDGGRAMTGADLVDYAVGEAIVAGERALR